MKPRLPVWLAAASLMALAAGVGGVPTPVDQAAAATPPDLRPADVAKTLHTGAGASGPDRSQPSLDSTPSVHPSMLPFGGPGPRSSVSAFSEAARIRAFSSS